MCRFAWRKILGETKCLNSVNSDRNGVSIGMYVKGKNMYLYEYLSMYHK